MRQFQSSIFDTDEGYMVRTIPTKDAYELLLTVHYARRIPSISYAYGLFDNGRFAGVVTYGTPSSSTLRAGVCGSDYADIVLELNRLCLTENNPNEASMLVGMSLKKLPDFRIVVSYADTEQKHLGVVYQATNFLYTGLSAKRTDWVVDGMEHLHGQTIADMTRGKENRAQQMRQIFGDKFRLEPRSRKHRYVTFTGTKGQRKLLKSKLLYPVLPYPKEQNNG